MASETVLWQYPNRFKEVLSEVLASCVAREKNIGDTLELSHLRRICR